MIDVWGKIYKDHWAGRTTRHEIERDDGLVTTFESAANYFKAPRCEAERDLLKQLYGPVLDLAAGAGSYALYLQNEGLHVTAADLSPGALDVCRARGCVDVTSIDLRALDIEPGSFRSVIVMGNTLGAHQTPETLRHFLLSLRRVVGLGGRLLFSMIDPLDTHDESHLLYQRTNIERGLPPGLIKMRVKYDRLVDDWMHLWMLTQQELISAMSETDWALLDQRHHGPLRIRLLESKTR